MGWVNLFRKRRNFMKRFAKVALVMALVCALTGSAWAAKKITVGAKNFTEQYVVGSMLALLLEDKGFDVTERMGTGSSVTRSALETGQIDLYPEYTGTAWQVYLKHDTNIYDPQELFEKVLEEDLEKNKIVWLEPAPLNNTYAMALRREDAEKMGNTLSALAEWNNAHPEELVFGVAQEFYERPDGFFKMAEIYGMEVPKGQVKLMDLGLTFEAIGKKQVDVAMCFATDGKIPKFDLVVLEDDKQFFPVYNLSFCVRQEVMEEYPELRGILEPLAEDLTDTVMQQLNYQVDVEGKPEDMVAREFLKDRGYID